MSFFNGLLGMVHELLQDCFAQDDFVSGFNLFFEVCGHIVQGHVPPSISHLFFTFQLLVLKKQSRSLHPIVINEVTYRLLAHILAI
jgi:hypothetical protein